MYFIQAYNFVKICEFTFSFAPLLPLNADDEMYCSVVSFKVLYHCEADVVQNPQLSLFTDATTSTQAYWGFSLQWRCLPLFSLIHVSQHRNKVIVLVGRYDGKEIQCWRYPSKLYWDPPKMKRNLEKSKTKNNKSQLFTEIRGMIWFVTPVTRSYQMKCARSVWVKVLGEVYPQKLHNMVHDCG